MDTGKVLKKIKTTEFLGLKYDLLGKSGLLVIQEGKAKMYTEVLRAGADTEVYVRSANGTIINFLTYCFKVFDECYLKSLHQKAKNNALTHCLSRLPCFPADPK